MIEVSPTDELAKTVEVVTRNLRFDLGEPDALTAAELVAVDVDNPVLHAGLDERNRNRVRTT